ncbi:MAG: hypothetical protein DRI28_01475 [Caldiserica bacterium]|nr:MAG: hypothetical protein DRI28_01475 [Caldisericota bacterium]
MNAHRVFSTFIALLKNLMRDKMAIFWFMIFPVLIIILFSSIFGGGGGNPVNFDIAVIEKDVPKNLSFLPDVFENADNFNIVKLDLKKAIKKLKEGNLSAVIVIDGETLEVYYNNSDPTISSMVPYMINGIVKEINIYLSGMEIPKIVKTKSIPIEAENFGFIDFYIPGIIAMALMQLGVFSAELMASLKERKILRRFLLTPLKKGEFIVSFSLTRIIVAVGQVLIMIALGHFVYKMNINMNFPLFVCFFLLGIILFSFMGVLVGGISKSVESANGLAQLINFPMMFLSGIFFTASFYPSFLQPVIKALPLTYLGNAMRNVIIKNASFSAVKLDFFVLLIWTVVVTAVALRLFRWE